MLLRCPEERVENNFKKKMKSYRIKIARKPLSALGWISRSVGRRSREMINPLYLALTAAPGDLRLVWSLRQDGH